MSGTSRPRAQVPGEIGIWAFVAGDLLVFSVFFILIAFGQKEMTDVFSTSRESLNLYFGLCNTLLLLTGSWFVAIGVERCRDGRGSDNVRWFKLAIGCGVVFVINKIFEWEAKIGAGFTPLTNDFFMYFFVFTGIHLLHVVVGVVVLIFLCKASRRPTLNSRDIRTLESGGIFWHLVDLLWLMLFALLYLL